MNVATSHHSLPLEMSKAHVSHHFEKVAVGGTWDHLHAGHKILLTMTAFISRHEVVCGVTGKHVTAVIT
jgi:phosphopantetheine adenylyltransferase